MEETNDITTVDTVNQTYDPALLDNIKRILEIQSKAGKPQSFEIEVDGLKVVPRTTVVEVFDSFKPFVHPTSKKVVVTVFRGIRTPACTKHIFVHDINSSSEQTGLGQVVQPVTNAGLSGADVRQMVSDLMEKERMAMRISGLEKDLATTEKQVNEAEEYIAKLQAAVSLLEKEKSAKNSALLDKLVDIAKNPPDWIKLAVLNFSKQGSKPLAGTEQAPEKAETKPPALSESEQKYIAVLRRMEEELEENDLHGLMIVNDKLIEEPELIPDVADLIDAPIPKLE